MRTLALQLVEQMQTYCSEETSDQHACWTEYIGSVQEVAHFIENEGAPKSGKDGQDPTRKQLEDFGILLRDRRDAAGFSRVQLARKARLSDATLKFTETARHPPSRRTLLRLLAIPELNLNWPDLPPHLGLALQGAQRSEASAAAPGAAEAKSGSADLNCYLTPSFEPVRMVMDLGRFLNGAGGHVEQTNAYLDHQSAAAYLTMCQQSAATAAARRHSPLGGIARAIVKMAEPVGLNVTALGAGDAQLEVRLVQHLAQEQAKPDIRFCLFDMSQPLLSAGFKYATDTLSQFPGISVWAIQGNFHHLPLYTQVHYSPAGTRRRRVYCMLGNTMANLDHEPRFFEHGLIDCVPGDLLVIDAQQAYGSPEEPETIRRRDPGLLAPLPKVYAEWLAGPIYRHCKDVTSVEFTMGLDLHCPTPGSYALEAVATVKATGRPERRFSMFRFKRYDVAKLAAHLSGLGWEQVVALPLEGSSPAEKPSVVLLFCKRP